LATILDIAIQIAWGLHVAHEASVVHQDVKPSNVLMTATGVPRITDFGLARAGIAAGAGMTPAYCSPEQANGEPLTRATDLWSWGVSVLEMLIGERSWATGVAAPHVLEDLLRGDGAPGRAAGLPPALGDVLSRCFADVADRWPTLLDAAATLIPV